MLGLFKKQPKAELLIYAHIDYWVYRDGQRKQVKQGVWVVGTSEEDCLDKIRNFIWEKIKGDNLKIVVAQSLPVNKSSDPTIAINIFIP